MTMTQIHQGLCTLNYVEFSAGLSVQNVQGITFSGTPCMYRFNYVFHITLLLVHLLVYPIVLSVMFMIMMMVLIP